MSSGKEELEWQDKQGPRINVKAAFCFLLELFHRLLFLGDKEDDRKSEGSDSGSA